MLKAGTQLQLTLEKPVAGGRMLARHDGQVVLVAGAIPGERVWARIDRVNKGMAFATTVNVIEPSPARRDAVGDPLCGGTVYAHVAYAEQAAIKRDVLRDALRHGGRIDWPGDLPITPSPEHGYRMRARLHVRKGRVGFFREGTHDLCDCAGTGQLLPASIEAVRAFVDATPRAVRDAIDAIELTESIAADERVLHVLWAPHARMNASTLNDIWRMDTLANLTGVTCDDPSTGRARTIAGQPWVSDPLDALLGSTGASIPRARLRRHAASFFQANRYLVPDLVAAVHRAVSGGAEANGDSRGPIIDLYAGVGLFAITLAALLDDVTPDAQDGHHAQDAPIVAIEGDPSSARDLAANAEALNASADDGPGASRHFNLEVEHSSVEHYLDRSVSVSAPSASAPHPPRCCRDPP